MSKNLRMLASVAAVGLSLSACGAKGSGDDKKSSEATTAAKETASAKSTSSAPAASASADASASYLDKAVTATASATPSNKGVFKYTFSPAEKPELKMFEPLFKAGGRIEQVVGALGVYKMPKDLPVVSGECGTPNAMYMPNKHAIKLCYELAADWYKRFTDLGADDKTASKSTLDALTFTVLHEMGHALVAELGLGISGGEEDAVDDFASLILIQNKKAEWAVAGTLALMQMSKGQKPAYFDEHSIGEQRLGNVLCLIYGSDPEHQRGIIEKVPDLAPRSAKCPTTYQRADTFWTNALKPFLGK
ncbi:MAG: DUF4344 domain-containing metallopeptidase [Polyangiaceae bacterium]